MQVHSMFKLFLRRQCTYIVLLLYIVESILAIAFWYEYAVLILEK